MNNNLFLGRTLKFWVLLAGVVTVCLLVILFFVKFTFYRISIAGTNTTSLIVIDKNSSRHQITTIFGVSLIPRQSLFIEANSDAKTTRVSVDERPVFGIKDISISLEEQKTVHKIGRESLGCNLANSIGTFTFQCSNSDRIVAFSNLSEGQWKNREERVLNPDSFYYSLYQEGILRLGDVASDEGGLSNQLHLEYVVPGKPGSEVKIISDVAFKVGDILTLYTDRSGGSGFVIMNITSGKAFYYSNLNASSQMIERKSHYEQLSDIVTCSLNSSNFACYFGPSTVSADGDEENKARENAVKKRDGSIAQIELYNLEKKTTTISNIKDSAIDEICLTTSNSLIGLSSHKIVAVTAKNNSQATINVLANDGVNIGCGKRTLYTTEDSIFIIDKSSSKLAFKTTRLDLSTITSFGDHIIFNVFVTPTNNKTSDRITHTYSLDVSKNIEGTRIENTLPILINGDKPILDMDYNDELIYVQPQYDFISNTLTGEIIIDQASFSSTCASIEADLSSQNLLNSRRFVCSPN